MPVLPPFGKVQGAGSECRAARLSVLNAPVPPRKPPRPFSAEENSPDRFAEFVPGISRLIAYLDVPIQRRVSNIQVSYSSSA